MCGEDRWLAGRRREEEELVVEVVGRLEEGSLLLCDQKMGRDRCQEGGRGRGRWMTGEVVGWTDASETDPGFHGLDEERVVPPCAGGLVRLLGHVESVNGQVDLNKDRDTASKTPVPSVSA